MDESRFDCKTSTVFVSGLDLLEPSLVSLIDKEDEPDVEGVKRPVATPESRVSEVAKIVDAAGRIDLDTGVVGVEEDEVAWGTDSERDEVSGGAREREGSKV